MPAAVAAPTSCCVLTAPMGTRGAPTQSPGAPHGAVPGDPLPPVLLTQRQRAAQRCLGSRAPTSSPSPWAEPGPSPDTRLCEVRGGTVPAPCAGADDNAVAPQPARCRRGARGGGEARLAVPAPWRQSWRCLALGRVLKRRLGPCTALLPAGEGRSPSYLASCRPPVPSVLSSAFCCFPIPGSAQGLEPGGGARLRHFGLCHPSPQGSVLPPCSLPRAAGTALCVPAPQGVRRHRVCVLPLPPTTDPLLFCSFIAPWLARIWSPCSPHHLGAAEEAKLGGLKNRDPPSALGFTRAQRPAGARWRWPAVFPGPAVGRGRAGSRRELRLRAGRGLLRRELSSGSHQRGGGSRLPGATHAGRPRGDAAGGLALPPAPGPAAAASAWARRGTAPRRCRWSRHPHVAPDRAFLLRGCPSVPLPHGFLELSGALWGREHSQLAPTAASGSLSPSCTGQRLCCVRPTCTWSIHPVGSAWPCCRDLALPFQRVLPTVFPIPSAAWGCKSRRCGAGDAGPWGCSPPTSHTQPLSQLGQHPVDSGDPAGPGAADTQGDRQQQRAEADAEHQRRFPVAENPHPAHGRGEAQQGGHPPADGGVHLLPGAGEDPATAAEHPAQAVHPGVQWLLPEAATGGGQRRGHWFAGHLGGREGRGPAAGDDRAPAAAGQGALGPHDAGGAGSLPGGPHVPREAEGDCSASAAPAAAGAGEVAAPGEARARAADPNPAPASTRSPSTHPPPHCDRTSTASLPSRHRGHHGPVLGHQHSLHVPAKPGHHRSGDPAHRGDTGEAAAGRGAAACRHRDARPRLPRALRLRHRLRHGGQRQ